MKKKLLILGALVTTMAANAQVVYVGDAAKLFVSTDALVYSGGNWMLDSNTEKSVENKGNIIIVGNYVKGTHKTIEGKEFVNVYTNAKDYGQVKILSATADATAKMTIQRPAASNSYFGASYAVSFPYVDKVDQLMNSFARMSTNDFKGDCQRDTPCDDRYKMTLTKWNNNKVHHDAVLKSDKFIAGDYYNLNLREKNMQNVMTGMIGYKGTPSGKSYSQAAKGIIPIATEAQFTSAKYSTWRRMTNPYDERYESYMGYVDTDSRLYGKNTYRFGNPYTSNLDLSAFEGADAWLNIKNNNKNHNIKTATADGYIYGFTIMKRMDSYSLKWTRLSGSINPNSDYYKARFDGEEWVGDAEALIVRPTETFNLYFESVDPMLLGKTRIVNVQVDFKDEHKTFDHVPSAKATTSRGLTTNGTAFRSMSVGRSLSNTSDDFNQLKLSLIKDNTLLGTSFLVGTSYYDMDAVDTNTSAGSIFVYGVKTDEIVYDAKKQFSRFNSISYVGKPLGVGFDHLTKGSTYQLGFNLYEGSIFNEVEKASEFFLKDMKTNEVVQIDPTKPYTFVADEDVARRFVIYWKQVPQTSSTKVEKPLTTPIASISQNTAIYEEAGRGKIRFENISKTADIQVYNVSGSLVYTAKGVSTDVDYTVNVNNPGMYIVKISYQNGEVRTLKFINK